MNYIIELINNKQFDSTDMFFIILITIYFITLFLFLFIFIIRYIEISFKFKNQVKPKINYLVKNPYYKNYISYVKNNPKI